MSTKATETLYFPRHGWDAADPWWSRRAALHGYDDPPTVSGSVRAYDVRPATEDDEAILRTSDTTWAVLHVRDLPGAEEAIADSYR